jgi:hypothetical protein
VAALLPLRQAEHDLVSDDGELQRASTSLQSVASSLGLTKEVATEVLGRGESNLPSNPHPAPTFLRSMHIADSYRRNASH